MRLRSLVRAVASMHSWEEGGGGGCVGKKFPNDEKSFRIFRDIRSYEGVCYPENEDTICKQKYAYFTHRHILRISTYIQGKSSPNFKAANV
jgi:hypothetical protein